MNSVSELWQSLKQFRLRYSIVHLFVAITCIAMFFIVLVNKNQWLTASYITGLTAIILKEFIGTLTARGLQQAYSIGFSIGCVIYYYILAADSSQLMLPGLITTKLYMVIEAMGGTTIDEGHYYLMTGSLWLLLTGHFSGLVGQRFRKTPEVNAVTDVDSPAEVST